jgi:hypothetical protein
MEDAEMSDRQGSAGAEGTESKDPTIGVRLNSSELAEVDGEIERRRAEDPGIRLSRAEIVRSLMHRGLRALRIERGAKG